MEALQATHRKQLKDLQNRITQKKKQATKKTRKGVNDECDTLERELKEQQAAEADALINPSSANPEHKDEDEISNTHTNGDRIRNGNETGDIEDDLADLAINSEPQAPSPPQQPPSQSSQSPQTPPPNDTFSPALKKPNRARARLARRQAEQEALFAQSTAEASTLPNLKALEREAMLSHFRKHNLQEKEIRADGHCLYSAVADQLLMQGVSLSTGEADGESAAGAGGSDAGLKARIPFLSKKEPAGEEMPYRVVRKAAAGYISAHPDDFVPFLEEPLDEYVGKIRDTGEWGGQLELLALAKTYGVGISVVQGDGRVERIEGGQGDEEEKRIWLAYYRHGFGLGEHYNSLHKIT